jgi:hypothetical protein
VTESVDVRSLELQKNIMVVVATLMTTRLTFMKQFVKDFDSMSARAMSFKNKPLGCGPTVVFLLNNLILMKSTT